MKREELRDKIFDTVKAHVMEARTGQRVSTMSIVDRVMSGVDGYINAQKVEVRSAYQEQVDGFVERLNALGPNDAEEAHEEADKILTEAVHPDIAAAYHRAQREIGFWYS